MARFDLFCLMRQVTLLAVMLVTAAAVWAQSPVTTVLHKPAKTRGAEIAALLAQCEVPKLPLKLSADIILVSSTLISDRLDGREISLRSYRFNRSLDKVLPELERAGAVLRFEPPGDLRKLPVGTVWHGYNEMDGVEATRELSCSWIVR